ncbi:MAG: DUF3488 and transglutaminase-like domain-containing protein, partial [Bacteriovorax sp.]|nr:DUF3488 and transglutaminase-like domain-containing protein [Bacteriovorax sp.]
KDLPTAISILVVLVVTLSIIIQKNIPRSFFKIILLVISLGLIKYLFTTFLVTEAGVSLVLILSALKLWELETENDHFNMFLILALLECCLFLLNPSFIVFLFGLLKMLIFFYFILKIRNYDLALLSGKRLIYLMAPSILLALALFYTFPRFTQGFISPVNNNLLFSGTDTQLPFKNLGPLNLSSKVVFKVYGLSNQQFPIPMLYWRQSILWDYKQDEWRAGYLNLKSEQVKTPTPTANYSISLIQDYNEFLPVLDGTSRLSKSSLDFIFFSENSFKLKNITRSPVNYEVMTSFKFIPKNYTPLMEKKGLRIPLEQKEFIAKLILGNNFGQPNISDQTKFLLLIDFFKNRKYEYSLSPPKYNSLIEFILSGKAGYCSHFASAFAYMARTIDLPSRIISGYQGGEINPFDQSLIIREMDGHVWVEIYLKNIGWQKFDPTSVVAPGRTEMGANAFHDSLSPFINLYLYQLPKSLFRFKVIDRFSLWLDYLNSYFNTNVLNFDKDRQQQFLNIFFPKSFSLGWLFVIILTSSMPLLWLFFNWINKKTLDKNEIRYLKFLARMKRNGVLKQKEESASQFQQKCLRNTDNLEDYIIQETNHYIMSFYQKP